jgi:hypothetical protein
LKGRRLAFDEDTVFRMSAGDFGNYLEVGLDQRFNLGLHEAGFHLFSTESPIEDHRL